ncbi:MAG TPA: class I adenylate-forming enzyme family protein [Microbacteriaceae bacterium]|nr:class I adenylate-forming enzyme family protein [Microbacteriaceae bacterium]
MATATLPEQEYRGKHERPAREQAECGRARSGTREACEFPGGALSGMLDAMNLVERFFAVAADDPHRVALATLHRTVTYGELSDTVRRVSAKLIRAGLKSGDVAAVSVRPELEPVFILALMQLGVTSFTATRRTLEAAGERVDCVIAEAGMGVHPQVSVDETFFEQLGSVAPLEDVAELRSTDPVRIVFSSGTTGAPKGVPFDSASLELRIAAAYETWYAEQSVHCTMGIDSISGYMVLLVDLLGGGRYTPPGPLVERPALLAQERTRVLYASVAQFADIVDAIESSGDGTLLSRLALERIEVAGSLMPPALIERTHRVFGMWPSCLYGSTESGPIARGELRPERPFHLGPLQPGIELQIVDDHGLQVAEGDVGAIRVRRSKMPTGYWPENRSAAGSGFHDGWFYPGDRAHLDPDGSLVLDGREGDVVNLSGVKLNLSQLDVWLSELPFAADAASVSFTNSLGEPRLVVAFVANEAVNPGRAQRAVARVVGTATVSAVVRVPQIPRNGLGKVQRDELLIFMRSHLPRLFG